MAKTTPSSTALAEQPSTTRRTTTSQDPMADAGQQAGESIGHLTERATDLGFKQADTRREQVAHGLEELAGGIRRVSSEMESEQPAVATVAQTAAEQTDRIARYLQETDARELIHNVENVARRQPLLFLGGAFLLGLAASRVLKAGTGGSGGQRQSSYDSGYGAEMGADYRATGPGRRTTAGTATSEGI